MLESFIFIFGLIIGSFLNVVIYRVPLGQSIAYPPSHCPQCQQQLAWYQLIPVVSYLWQAGKCRQCGAPIALRYVLIELVTGFCFLGLYLYYGLTYQLLHALIFISILIPIVCIDYEHQIIPDSINLTGAILGLIIVPLTSLTYSNALLGVLVGGGVMLLIAVLSRGGMGGGDIKMMAMAGLFLGWPMTLMALFLSFVLGGIGSLVLLLTGIKKRKDAIPFGPFLAVGGFLAYVYGEEFLHWYLKTAF